MSAMLFTCGKLRSMCVRRSRPPEEKCDVRIDEARRRRAAAEVDAVGRGSREALDLGRRADGEDAPVADRDRLGDAILRIHRQDASVDENAVGRSVRPCGQAQAPDHDCRRQRSPMAFPLGLAC